MFRVLLLVVLVCVQFVSAVYIPCPAGQGLVDPNKSDPDNKTCRPCKIKGCTVCTWDYSRCTQCPAYYGPAGSINDDGASNCKRCRSKSCGVCDNGFDAPCTGKVRSCSNKVKTTRSAKKVSVKDIVGDSTNARCWTNKQYFYGNGYSWLTTYQINAKGQCIECQSSTWWRPLEYGSNYCWWYSEALKVVAAAADGCSVDDVARNTKLVKQCMTGYHENIFQIRAAFKLKCGSKRMTVYVESDGDVSKTGGNNPYDVFQEDGTLAWTYAVK